VEVTGSGPSPRFAGLRIAAPMPGHKQQMHMPHAVLAQEGQHRVSQNSAM